MTSILFTACTSINSSDGGSMNIQPQTVGPVDDYRPLYTVNEKVQVSGSANVNILFGIFVWSDNSSFADNASISGDRPFGHFSKLKSAIFPGVAFLPSAKNVAAKAAFYQACKAGKCDAVVAARYDITTEDYFVFKKMNVKISGFPAKVTSLETVKPLPYYIDATGKIVILDKFVKPYCLMDLHTKKGCSLF